MSKWENGRLELGDLGSLVLYRASENPLLYSWWWTNKDIEYQGIRYRTKTGAKRAAVRWLLAALKQAEKKIGA